MQVKYVGHNWGCHPETCCCLEWAIFKGETLVSKHISKEEALRIAKLMEAK